MPTYEYQARNRNGEVTSGVIIAENEAQMRQTLRYRDLFVTSYGIREDHAVRPGTNVLGKRRVKLNDMVVASRQLATLVRAGLPIIECLEALQSQTENPTLANALGAVRTDVLAGDSLAVAMGKHPKVFNELYVSLVEAGEAGGMLDQTLEVAADQFDKQAHLREQVRSAMMYPIIVVVASIGVVAFMLVFIVPIFARIYRQFKADLPFITRFLVWLSEGILRWWWLVILGVIGLVLLYRRYYATEQGRKVIDNFKLRIPIVGPLLRKIAIAQFTQTWAGTTRGGIPIIGALQVSAKTSNNVIVRDAAMKLAIDVQTGAPLSSSLEETGVFPPMVTRMVASGERSGNLDEMLEELTRFYERDIEHSVQRLTRLMEPTLTVLVGGIVLFVLLALYMPVFSLGQVIRKR